MIRPDGVALRGDFVRNLLLILFLTQFLTCNALAQEEEERSDIPIERRWPDIGVDIGEEEASEEESVIKEDGYDVFKSVESAKQIILEQRGQLAETKEKKEKIEDQAEELEEVVRKEIYEQQIVQEVGQQAPMTRLERKLQRVKLRRQLMVEAGKEQERAYKIRRSFSLQVKETYDDNIFLDKVDEKWDYITAVSPSALFSLQSKYVVVDINYVIDIEEYKRNSRQGGKSHLLLTYIRPGTLKLPLLNKKTGRLGIEMQNDFQPLVTSVATSEQAGRTERTYNKFFIAADYYMSKKRTFALEYASTFQNYRTAGFEAYSYTEHDLSPTFYFHFRPKWSFFTGYTYGIMDYTEGSQDATYQRLRAGVTGTLFKKLLTSIEVSNNWKSYAESTHGDMSHVFFKSSFMNKFSPETMASLEYSHAASESAYTDNAYYISDVFDFNAEHKFTSKTTGTLGFSWTHNRYNRNTVEDGKNRKRRDAISVPSIGLTYHFRDWLSGQLRYAHKRKASNFATYNYEDNMLSGTMNVKF
ncbi:MAG: outer membrane beta-barrel protein [Candidatus Omnitrophica bacterium]|nr:outer membrane beta-barrel protein [Candidatus Omnitrophota bacterium]